MRKNKYKDLEVKKIETETTWSNQDVFLIIIITMSLTMTITACLMV